MEGIFKAFLRSIKMAIIIVSSLFTIQKQLLELHLDFSERNEIIKASELQNNRSGLIIEH